MHNPALTPVCAFNFAAFGLLAAAGFGLAGTAQAQLVTTPQQRSTAQQVAQAGVALGDLAANAPERYTIKRGDTLWSISTLFLKGPWRWPELWGMNLNDIQNPHRIYPGQVLVLEKANGRATLRVAGDASKTEGTLLTVKVSPRTRFDTLQDSAIPSLNIRDLEPFLAQPMLVTEAELAGAARIVATQEGRVLLSKGDRAYARASDGTLLQAQQAGAPNWRIVRNATALLDPQTKAVLGYEAEYVGRAELVRSEKSLSAASADAKAPREVEPATFDVTQSLQEARVGDRLLPEPEREFLEFIPRAPSDPTDGRVVAIYGASGNLFATQNQVIVINRGAAHGVERGHVLALLKDGEVLRDATQPVRTADTLKLPDERSGLMMVFKAYDKVSYALLLTATDALRVGDRFTNPR